MLAASGLQQVRHADRSAVGSGKKCRAKRHVLDVSAREANLPRQPVKLDVISQGGFGRKREMPDSAPVLFVRERKLDDRLKAPHERLVQILAKIGGENAHPLVLLHFLQQVRNLEVGV